MTIYWFLIWTNLNPPHPWMHCAKFGWNWHSGSGEEDFLISSMYFSFFVISSPWKRTGTFIWTNLNSLHPRMFCDKFGWNKPSGSGEVDENVKSLRQRRRRQGRRATDKFWSEKLTWAFGSGELKKNCTFTGRVTLEHVAHIKRISITQGILYFVCVSWFCVFQWTNLTIYMYLQSNKN